MKARVEASPFSFARNRRGLAGPWALLAQHVLESIRRCLYGGCCYKMDSQGLLQARSAETIPADPDSTVQVVSYAVAPFGAQEYNRQFEIRLERVNYQAYLEDRKIALN